MPDSTQESIKHSLLPAINITIIEAVGIRVFTVNNSHIDIISCQFPGGSSPENLALFKKEIIHQISQLESLPILSSDHIVSYSKSKTIACYDLANWGNNQTYNVNLQYLIVTEADIDESIYQLTTVIQNSIDEHVHVEDNLDQYIYIAARHPTTNHPSKYAEQTMAKTSRPAATSDCLFVNTLHSIRLSISTQKK